MAMTGSPTVGDVGTSVRLTIRNDTTNALVNLSTFTSGTFTFERPDNSSFSVACGLFTDGTDGTLSYTSISTTFDQAGRWRVQPTYTLTSPPGTWTGTPETFTVKPLIASD